MDKSIFKLKNSGFTLLEPINGEYRLPDSAIAFMEETGMLKYQFCICQIFYRGDIETTNDWLIANDNGAFYKVGAEYITWYRNPQNKEEILSRCNWSGSELLKTINSVLQGKIAERDPDYES